MPVSDGEVSFLSASHPEQDPSPRNGDFPNMVVSSELAPFWGAPGIKPTLRFGEIDAGRYTPRANS